MAHLRDAHRLILTIVGAQESTLVRLLSLIFCLLVFFFAGGSLPCFSQLFKARTPVVFSSSAPELEDLLDEATLSALKGDGKATAFAYQKMLDWAHNTKASDQLILEINLRAADELEGMMYPRMSRESIRFDSYARKASQDLMAHPEKRKQLFLLTEPFYCNALALVQKSASFKTHRAEVLEALADICHTKGELGKEEEFLKQALHEIDPQNSSHEVVLMQEAYVWLAALSIRRGQMQEAEGYLTHAIQACTAKQEAIFEQGAKLAALYIKLGKPALAVPLYAQVVQRDAAKKADSFWTADHLLQYERALRLSGRVKEDKIVRARLKQIERENPRYFKAEGEAYWGPWRSWGHTIDDPRDPKDDLRGLAI